MAYDSRIHDTHAVCYASTHGWPVCTYMRVPKRVYVCLVVLCSAYGWMYTIHSYALCATVHMAENREVDVIANVCIRCVRMDRRVRVHVLFCLSSQYAESIYIYI